MGRVIVLLNQLRWNTSSVIDSNDRCRAQYPRQFIHIMVDIIHGGVLAVNNDAHQPFSSY